MAKKDTTSKIQTLRSPFIPAFFLFSETASWFTLGLIRDLAVDVELIALLAGFVLKKNKVCLPLYAKEEVKIML
jgi:hypothetical protein